MFKEFKEFAMKGNLIDHAVGFVMGAAFTKVTNTFINGIVIPPISLIQGKNFSDWKVVLKGASFENGKEVNSEVAIRYGDFITVFTEFLIVAFVMFLVVKAINKLKRAKEEVPAPPPVQEVLLTEIRDLLKKQSS
jgi:large conductance mechanosensitive channel